MHRRLDPLRISLAIAAFTAEALGFAPWLTWLTGIVVHVPSEAPQWWSMTTTSLFAFAFARLVLVRLTDTTVARSLAVVAWLIWTSLWWIARERHPGFLPALLHFEGMAVGLLLLNGLLWLRALALASEPHPFQGSYLRWAVVRDVVLVSSIAVAAALSSGDLSATLSAQLTWTAPTLLVVRLFTAALVQVEAVSLAYPEAFTPVAWLTRTVAATGAIVLLGAIGSLLAGPALWAWVARPLEWLFLLLVAVLVTVTVGLVVVIWTAVRLAAWLLRDLISPHEPSPPPSLPTLPELLQPQTLLAELPVPHWLIEVVAGSLGILLCLLLARLVARAFRRRRDLSRPAVGNESRERLASPSVRSLLTTLPRVRRPRATFPWLAPPRDVRSAYRATLARFALLGLPRKPSETPLLFERRASAAYPQVTELLADLTVRYLRARYGECETESDRSAALAAWRTIEERLRTNGDRQRAH